MQSPVPLKPTTFCTYKYKFLKNSLTIFHFSPSKALGHRSEADDILY